MIHQFVKIFLRFFPEEKIMTESALSYALEPCSIPCSPTLTVKFGADAALVLQQIHYWLKKGAGRVIDGTRWIYNTLDDWVEQFPWMTKWIFRRVMKVLRERGLVKFCQHEKRQWKRRGWYTIDYNVLKIFLPSICELEPHVDVLDEHTSYIEAETTSKNNNINTHPTHPAAEKNSICKKPQKKHKRSSQGKNSGKPSVQRYDATDPGKNSGKPSVQSAPPQEPTQPETSSQTNVARSQEAATPEINSLLEQIEDLGVRVNPQIEKVVKLASVRIVKDAIALLRHKRRTHQPLRNPAGFLVRAIENHWKPESSETSAPEGFSEWFEALHKAGVLLASTLDRETGQLWVFDRDGNCYPYEEMLARFPRRELLKRR